MIENILTRIPAKVSRWAEKRAEKHHFETDKVAQEILCHKDSFQARRVADCSPQIVKVAKTLGEVRNLAPFALSRKKAEMRFGAGMYETLVYPSLVSVDYPFPITTKVFEAKMVGVAAAKTEFSKEQPNQAMPLYARAEPGRALLPLGRKGLVLSFL